MSMARSIGRRRHRLLGRSFRGRQRREVETKRVWEEEKARMRVEVRENYVEEEEK